MMKKGTRWALAAAAGMMLLFAGCGSDSSPKTASRQPVYTVGTTGAAPRWSEEGDQGGVQGFDIDVWKEIGKRNGWDIQWKAADFTALWGMLDNGDIISIANDTTKNAEREEKYNFSSNYAYGGYIFMTKKDFPAAGDGIEAFRNKTVAVQGDTNMKLALEAQMAETGVPLEVMNMDNQSAAIMTVANGQADAVYVNRVVGYIAMHDLKLDMAVHDAKYRYMPICYPFKKTEASDTVREAVNRTIDDMHRDGTLKALSEKWFGADFTYDPSQKNGES